MSSRPNVNSPACHQTRYVPSKLKVNISVILYTSVYKYYTATVINLSNKSVYGDTTWKEKQPLPPTSTQLSLSVHIHIYLKINS